MAKKVVVGKVDLDTCGTAFFLEIGDTVLFQVEVVRSGRANPDDLEDPGVLCIEVGDSGGVEDNNFDHHGRRDLPSASLQAFWVRMVKNLTEEVSLPGARLLTRWEAEQRLAQYIDVLDRKGPKTMGEAPGFPTLSQLFSGMLLVTRDPVEQFWKGLDLLREVYLLDIDPWGVIPVDKMPDWSTYAEAKAKNDRQVAEAAKQAQWEKTSSGLKLAWLETDFFGAPGALYGVGAQVVVAFSPHFGPAGVPKFTVAGNSIKVDKVLSELNARESGWGGPPTGTIIGSPREGSKLTLEEVVEVVREGL